MNKPSMLLGLMVGMIGGACLYAYMEMHPMKMQMLKNNMKNVIKDLT